ncbi:MAG: glycosyltransferase family 1 protein [Chitinophagaceae bacterium]
MVIAVNTRFLLKDYLEGYGYFIYETFTRMAVKYPEHKFIFIFDRAFDCNLQFPINVTMVIKGPGARHPILWWIWYNFSLPAVAKEYHADVIVSPDGFCSLNTNIPQCLVVHDLSFLHYPAFNKKSHLRFSKFFMPKFLKRAASIATVSEFSKYDIIKQYKIPTAKIDVVYSGISAQFLPVSLEEREKTKSAYSDGREYFLFTGAIHPRNNLVNLLKAFSIFKKRQKSGMKLVIAGRIASQYESFLNSLKSYKFREDVVLTGYLERTELVKLTASAYAMIYPSFFEGFGVPPLEAMRCGVPVVTSPNSAMQEICADAALYADPNNPADIATQIMLLFKDENLRNEMISAGLAHSQIYNWDRTANLLWESIIRACKK